MSSYLKHFGLFAAVSLIHGCSGNGNQHQESESPAIVENAVEETELASIILSPQAESRLAIQTAPVEYRRVQRTRTLGGEVEVVPGNSVAVTAPVVGMVIVPEDASLPRAGRPVAKGQPLCRLLPTLSERDLLSAREEVTLRRVQFELAQTRARRAERMLNDRAGSVREHEEAQAELNRAEVTLEIAEAQLELLESGRPDHTSDVLSSLVITSPVDGVLQDVFVTAGQTVTASTPLFDITDMDPLWVRVPVYSGDLVTINSRKAALVHSLADVAGIDARQARPIAAPLTADPRSVTSDIFFELPNRDSSFRPGQRVSVVLFLNESEERLVIPYSAVLYDMYGGAWVYTTTASHVYVRARIELDYVSGELAVLSHGPPAGTRVVHTGAAELFGTEFGVGK